MLMISIFTTMLIMVFFTRYLLKMFVESNYFEDKVNFFIGKANHINLRLILLNILNYLLLYL